MARPKRVIERKVTSCPVRKGTGEIEVVTGEKRYDYQLSLAKRDLAIRLYKEGMTYERIRVACGWKQIRSVYMAIKYAKGHGLIGD